jgi:halocyanin-like protein
MDSSETNRRFSRRGILRAGAGAAVGLAATSSLGTAAAQDQPYNGYLAEEDNWADGAGTADASGVDEPIVRVGAKGNGGNFAFGPVAIYIEPGQTITWEWTGEGGGHNVYHSVEDDPARDEQAFLSDLYSEQGETFEHTFEEGDEGWYPYYCQPHVANPMLGVVVVGEDNVQGEITEYGLVDPFTVSSSVWTGAGVFGAVSLIGVAAYNELVNGTEALTAGTEADSPADEGVDEPADDGSEAADAADDTDE